MSVRLAIGISTEAVEAVLAGRAEIGFVESAVDDPALAVSDLALDQLIVVVAPGHPWAERGTIGPDGIAGSAWMLREAGSGTHRARSIWRWSCRATRR